jgi:hypothetical protein
MTRPKLNEQSGDAMMIQWRANFAMAAWAILFISSLFMTKLPYVAPLSFLVVVLVAWDYGFRRALVWIAFVHLLIPCGLAAFEIGPFFVFVEARGMVALIMALTFVAVTALAYLTDRVHALTRELRDSRTATQLMNGQLQAALAEVKELHGLLAICASCKDIRDHSSGKWEKMESYITKHSHATFTHGLCPKCLQEQLRRWTPAPESV